MGQIDNAAVKTSGIVTNEKAQHFFFLAKVNSNGLLIKQST